MANQKVMATFLKINYQVYWDKEEEKGFVLSLALIP